MYNYVRRIDRKINNTLNLYQDLGNLSIPFFRYILIVFSLLIVTSCVTIIFSLDNSSNVSYSKSEVWLNYSLPIIIYGIICPVLSTVISLIFKFFF